MQATGIRRYWIKSRVRSVATVSLRARIILLRAAPCSSSSCGSTSSSSRPCRKVRGSWRAGAGSRKRSEEWSTLIAGPRLRFSALFTAEGHKALRVGDLKHARHAEACRVGLRDLRRDRRPADRGVQGPAGVEVRRRSGRHRFGAVRGVEAAKNFSAPSQPKEASLPCCRAGPARWRRVYK